MIVNGQNIEALIRDAGGYRYEKQRADYASQILYALIKSKGEMRVSEVGFNAADRKNVRVGYDPATREFVLTA